MMYPFKVLNKKKYALCFINAFLENICLYIMPVIFNASYIVNIFNCTF